jgi:hypothetical protein
MTHDLAPAAGGPRRGEAAAAKVPVPETSKEGRIIVILPVTGDVTGRNVDEAYSRCKVAADPPEPLRLERYSLGLTGDVTGLSAEPRVKASVSTASVKRTWPPGRSNSSDLDAVVSNGLPVSL